MPSESLRWETLQALKNSPKGKITFDPFWSERGEPILAGCRETLGLSPRSALVLERLTPHRASFPGDPPQGDPPPSVSSGGSFTDLTPGAPPPPTGDKQQVPDGESLDTAAPPPGAPPPGAPPTAPPTAPPPGAPPTAPPTAPPPGAPPTAPPTAPPPGAPPTAPPTTAPPTAPPPGLSLPSPRAMETAGCIIQFQEEQREKAKAALRRRQQAAERLAALAASEESEKLKRYEELQELKQRQELQGLQDRMDQETKESMGRQEKLKEEQRHRTKILNLRLREAEQQRLRLEEQQRLRQEEGRERLRGLNSIQEEILQLNQLLGGAGGGAGGGGASGGGGAYSGRGNQLCSQLSEVVRNTAEGEFPSPEDMAVAERALLQMRALVQQLQQEADQAREQKKKEQEQEEELRRQQELAANQEARRKKEQAAKEKAQRRGLQNSAEDATLRWYRELQEAAARCSQAFHQLNSPTDAQTKKLKLELQKSASIPVSQISSNSGSQLREIFDRIDRLLSARPVVSGGRSVSTAQHPQARHFVSYKLAEKFVKQGEEEVASHHEAAFPIAMVASGIWELHPQVGDLILAHLHKKCPYAVPHYPPMKEGTAVEEYQRILGYRVEDGGVEGQESFLKRMSGMIRLYAAIIQLRWPYGAKQEPPPHGLNHGWRWLAQMLNMEPLADITATLLFDFLEVCGHALVKQYQGQFWKLLLLLKEAYFPRIEAVTSSGQMGSVIRLKQFLETSLQSRQIRPPKGQLGSSFWSS